MTCERRFHPDPETWQDREILSEREQYIREQEAAGLPPPAQHAALRAPAENVRGFCHHDDARTCVMCAPAADAPPPLVIAEAGTRALPCGACGGHHWPLPCPPPRSRPGRRVLLVQCAELEAMLVEAVLLEDTHYTSCVPKACVCLDARRHAFLAARRAVRVARKALADFDGEAAAERELAPGECVT